jgi:hypothetical protein
MSKFHQKRYNGVHAIDDTPASVRIDCTDDTAFTRKYGKRVKAAGGRYSECRGHQSTRYVQIPCEGNAALINAVARDFGRGSYYATKAPKGTVTMVAEVRGGGLQSWITVHYVPREGEGEIFDRFVASWHAALQQACDRGHISGVYAGPVPELYATMKQAGARFQAAEGVLKAAEAYVLQIALASGQDVTATSPMGALAEAIRGCLDARTEREEAGKALEAAKAEYKAFYSSEVAA